MERMPILQPQRTVPITQMILFPRKQQRAQMELMRKPATVNQQPVEQVHMVIQGLAEVRATTATPVVTVTLE